MVVILFLAACGKSDAERIDAVVDRSMTPQLHAENITTLISDSGITRYRINAALWDIYDKAEEPYWEFPSGIYFERFAPDLTVDANIESNYAKYFEKKQLWELKGDVKATNLQGERFESEIMYWDQKNERIYSDTAIVVYREKYIINAMGFESNQTLTQYDFYKTTGIIYIDADEDEVDNDSTKRQNLPHTPVSPTPAPVPAPEQNRLQRPVSPTRAPAPEQNRLQRPVSPTHAPAPEQNRLHAPVSSTHAPAPEQ
jgi:LPS export ABC transporter protein LptC